MEISHEKILILAPHTDDAEFGCGGSIVKLVENNCSVHVVAFSIAEESVPDNVPKNINKQYMKDAMAILGVKEENIIIKNYPVRNFPSVRQSILEDLVEINRKITPSIVFLPSTFDTHQDHQVVSQEGFRAFKKVTILGYELPWNNLTFTTNCFIPLQEEHVNKKLNSLQCYISQMGRDYISKDFLKSVMRTRGGQMGKKYAEAFELIRLLL